MTLFIRGGLKKMSKITKSDLKWVFNEALSLKKKGLETLEIEGFCKMVFTPSDQAQKRKPRRKQAQEKDDILKRVINDPNTASDPEKFEEAEFMSKRGRGWQMQPM